jgi:hypothetical protein
MVGHVHPENPKVMENLKLREMMGLKERAKQEKSRNNF